MTSTISSLNKYDIVVLQFPFSSQEKLKARPAVIISSESFNNSKRDDLMVLAISSSFENKLSFETEIINWQSAGLLKPSLFKAAIATIEKGLVIQKLGTLEEIDQQALTKLLNQILALKK